MKLKGDHTNIFQITQDDEIIFVKERPAPHAKSVSKVYLQSQKFADIWNFATETPIEQISFMKQAADLNMALSREGLKHSYGVGLGRSLVGTAESEGTLDNKILIQTVAASDARMGGATLPAMSNSGSGNQGISATIPVCVVANEIDVDEEKLIRALTLSHLTANIHSRFFTSFISFLCSRFCSYGFSGGDYLLDGQRF